MTKREHYLTYRGIEYGPYATLELMLRELLWMMQSDEQQGRQPPMGLTFRTVEEACNAS